MSLVVNNNMMAANTARNLNAHYGRLATSTQRLSSGLRVNSAADDAAGLAIRELQRADIAALQQGARNANDAISMIQVADGSLGIIDEKLIRMKELAEQAATGTYDSTQRLMIESEYQAMASEITRIANATDFNGTKLLDGTLAGDHDGSGLISEGKMKIHFGTGNDSAEDYYYVEIGECTSEALGLGNNSTWQDVQRRASTAFKDSLLKQIKNDTSLSDEDKGKLLAAVEEMTAAMNGAISNAVDPAKAYVFWGASDGEAPDIDAAQLVMDITQAMGDAKSAFETDNNIDLTATPPTTLTAQNYSDMYDAVLKAAENEATKAGLTDVSGISAAITKAYNDDLANLANATAPTDAEYTQMYNDVLNEAQTAANDAVNNLVPPDDDGFLKDGKKWVGNSDLMERYMAAANEAAQEAANAEPVAGADAAILLAINDAIAQARKENAADVPGIAGSAPAGQDYIDKIAGAAVAVAKKNGFDDQSIVFLTNVFGSGAANTALANAITAATNAGRPLEDSDLDDWYDALKTGVDGLTAEAEAAAKVNAVEDETAKKINEKFWSKLRETEKQKLQYAWGQAALYNLANGELTNDEAEFGMGLENFDFGALAGFADGSAESATAEKILNQALKDMQAKVGHMDFAGHTVETQEDAQMALDAINEAIVSKDKIRAHLGAAQNRLENTVSNLNIQAENLQAAESRISDVDVATEMTEFVRNQILTQSAVAMLSQANSLPQMAMQLIGG